MKGRGPERIHVFTAPSGPPGVAADGPLELKGDAVHVWSLPLAVSPERIAALGSWLDPGEGQRADRFRFQRHRDRFVAGRGQMREVLAGYLGVEPQAVVFEYGPAGKPRVAGEGALRFNLSHSEDEAVLETVAEQDRLAPQACLTDRHNELRPGRHVCAEFTQCLPRDSISLRDFDQALLVLWRVPIADGNAPYGFTINLDRRRIQVDSSLARHIGRLSCFHRADRHLSARFPAMPFAALPLYRRSRVQQIVPRAIVASGLVAVPRTLPSTRPLGGWEPPCRDSSIRDLGPIADFSSRLVSPVIPAKYVGRLP